MLGLIFIIGMTSICGGIIGVFTLVFSSTGGNKGEVKDNKKAGLSLLKVSGVLALLTIILIIIHKSCT